MARGYPLTLTCHLAGDQHAALTIEGKRKRFIDGITAGHNDPYSGSNDDADRLNKLSDALYLLTFSPEYQIKK